MSYQGPITDSEVIEGLNLRYLKFFGLWKIINDYRTTGKRNRIFKVTVLLSFILASPYLIFQYMSYFSIEVDIPKATFLNLSSISAVQLCCRIIIFWYRIESQCRLTNLVKKNFLSIPVKKRKVVDKIFKKISKTSNICCTTYMISNVIIISILILNPDTSVDYILYHTGYMDDVTSGKKKILGGWYPFPMAESPYYEIIFAYEAVCAIWAGLLLAVYFCLFFQVLMCLYAQFTVLGFHIGTLKIDFDNDKQFRNSDSRTSETLNRILRDHQNLLRYSDEVRSVYNPLVTMTLGMGVLILVIAVMQFLLQKASPVFMIKILQVFLFQGVEVSLFCFVSSFIESASSDLQFATYSSDWYMANINFRKAVHMMMIGAKKGVGLTAIGMIPVNRETLLTILQFTYSTSTLVTSMTE